MGMTRIPKGSDSSQRLHYKLKYVNAANQQLLSLQEHPKMRNLPSSKHAKYKKNGLHVCESICAWVSYIIDYDSDVIKGFIKYFKI